MSKKQNQKKDYVNQYMAEKAGMEQVDKQKIAQVVKKLTQGSPKSLYEKQMSQKRQLQLAQMLRKTLQFTIQQKRQMKMTWSLEIKKMNQNRQLDKYWAHLDFDMFYVACQMLDRPQLKDKPCAVGGQYSVICTSNYIARKYGVRAAQPSFIAKKLCPELILIPPNFTKYKKYSNIFRDILRGFDKDLQSMGLDEAHIQLTDYLKGKNLQQQQKFIQNIRTQIFKQTGLTVSCGVGANKMLAKLASQQRKPNGQFVLENSQQKILDFMSSKKIRKIPGIGPVNQFFLKGLGIQSAKDILQNTDVLSICFSSNSTQFYISAALGLGQTQHQFVQRKSLGKSQTFKATNDLQFLLHKVYQICEEVSMQLEELGYVSKNIVFTYQNQMFSKKDKTFQLSKYTSSKQDLIQPILPYLQDYIQLKKQKVRLLGARCTNILKVQQLRKIQLDKYLVKPAQQSAQSENQNKQKEKIIRQPMKFFCPICNEQIDCKGNLAAFNRHIDKCMKQENKQIQEQMKKEYNNQKVNSEEKIQKKSMKNTKSQKFDRKSTQKQQKGSILNFFKRKLDQKQNQVNK